MDSEAQPVRPVLWLVDPADDPGGRRDRLRSEATAAGFAVRVNRGCRQRSAPFPGTAVVVGHADDLDCPYLRTSGVPVIRYSGGTVELPPDTDPRLEFRVVREVARGTSGWTPGAAGFAALRSWLESGRADPPPDWIAAAAPPPHPLLAFHLLCQGYLAVAGATGRSNRVARALAELGPDGESCLLAAGEQAQAAARPRVWFAPALKQVAAFIGGADAFWSAQAADRRWPPAAGAVHELWRVLVSGEAVTADRWVALVEAADAGFEAAVAAGCL